MMPMPSSVIQAPSTSKIGNDSEHDVHDMANTTLNQSDEIISDDEARLRREQLNRRPSYRMILNDLETVDKQLKEEPDELSNPSIGHSSRQLVDIVAAMQTAGPTSNLYPAVTGSHQHVQVSNGELNSLGIHTPNVTVSLSQYSPQLQGVPTNRIQDPSNLGALHLPRNDDVLGIKTISDPRLSTSVFINPALMSGYNSSPSPLGTVGARNRFGDGNDDNTQKRQVRLQKNREAAKECRRKKKEYVKCLENRVAVLENQNKALIEELKTLKELYCRKEKGD